MRDCLALAGVFSAVAGVEETATDGNKGVVVFTIAVSFASANASELFLPL